jgi:superfamily II DNA or RNA helicase
MPVFFDNYILKTIHMHEEKKMLASLNELELVAAKYIAFSFNDVSTSQITSAVMHYFHDKKKLISHKKIMEAVINLEIAGIINKTNSSWYSIALNYEYILVNAIKENKKDGEVFLDYLFPILTSTGRYGFRWMSYLDKLSFAMAPVQAFIAGTASQIEKSLVFFNTFKDNLKINDPDDIDRTMFCFLLDKIVKYAYEMPLLQKLLLGNQDLFTDNLFLNIDADPHLTAAISKLEDNSEIKQLFSLYSSFNSGNISGAMELAQKLGKKAPHSLVLWCAYLKGEDTGTMLSQILQQQAACNNVKQEYVAAGIAAVWHAGHIVLSDTAKTSKINKYIKDNSNLSLELEYILKMYVSFSKCMPLPTGLYVFSADSIHSKYNIRPGWAMIINYMCRVWLKDKFSKSSVQHLVDFKTEAERAKMFYIMAEAEMLLYKITKSKTYLDSAMQLMQRLGISRLLSDMYEPPSDWEIRLNLLSAYAGKNTGAAVVESQERLIWLINEKNGNIQPIIQKQSKTGSWSKGRSVALSRLKKLEVDCITEYDRPVLSKLRHYDNYYASSEYVWDDNAVTALAGHPLLFLESAPSIPIELEADEIELVVTEKGNSCTFAFSQSLSDDAKLVKYGTNRYKVTVASKDILKLYEIIGKSLTVPSQAKPKVLETLRNLSQTVKINSPLIGAQTGAEKVNASTRIYAHLTPLGSGIKAELYIKPMDPEPPYLKPGEGLKKITGHKGDIHIWTERDLSAELESTRRVMEACPIFASQAESDNAAIFDDPAECLQVLSEFRDAQEYITAEWPKGQKMHIKTKLGADSFSFKLNKKNNWFDLQGEVNIDTDEVVSLVKMMKLMEGSSSRFVEMEPGVYIELEKHFVKQLEFLRTVSDIGSKEIKLHPLAAISNSALFDSAASFTADKEWNSFVKKVKKTEKANYELPKNIQADLRPYQLEGYQWLRRMADWGTGACLADDMGLGKTLQCIALLLSRAGQGPSMVVAPTSVCRNWITEIEKFAPGLDPVLFGQTERKNAIETIGAGGVLIVSYGLLGTEAELLASRNWNVYVLDEAHAIKNIATKRSQVAMSINAEFRIAATGTPLQNHMGELWNLFQFLNPGLLGSQQHFNERFVNPIEKSNSDIARRSLKELIKPFILRRTKNQVLHDLPEKTEITLSVELSAQERNFYEAMRIKALEEIQKLDNTANSGEKQMRVLAEIMKLRMACCHSSLANKDINIESAKLARFEELVEHLIDNGHKALVFSQFIGHLSLIRKMLDSKAISYEYLDGSTSQKERELRINRFQKGSADIFLISLKAGGVGLNLTAADYVIHMDPWWNPAIEDQASDRAHRIGQTKPVTIYRLVTKETIEDKIVQLHRDKRDLADSLLEGSEAAAKVTADDLIGLLKAL